VSNSDREVARRRALRVGGVLFAALVVAAGVWWLDDSMAEYRAQRAAKEAAAEAALKAHDEKRAQAEQLMRAERERRQGEAQRR
jgi:hypothetical protein